MKPKKLKAKRFYAASDLFTAPSTARVISDKRAYSDDISVAVISVSDEEALVEQAAQAQVAACNLLFPDWRPSWAEIERAREYVRAGLESLGILKPRRKGAKS